LFTYYSDALYNFTWEFSLLIKKLSPVVYQVKLCTSSCTRIYYTRIYYTWYLYYRICTSCLY